MLHSVSLENIWSFTCMGRSPGCDCPGCFRWRAGERSGAATESLPTPTSLGNPQFAVAIFNDTTGSSTNVVLTPVDFQVNGNPTLTVAQGELCWVYANRAGTAWRAQCHMTSQRP